jgi:FkbM family methyltransferase
MNAPAPLKAIAPAPQWRPSWTLEERLRIALVPAGLHLRFMAARELRRGEREYALLPRLTPRHRVALDIGANKGVWSYALARLARRVHAFEPNPKIFPELARALKGKVELHQLALSDRAGAAEFRIPWRGHGYSNQGGSLSKIAIAGEHAVTTVQTARLDDLGIADVGFIKIDVEGSELAVLSGARETIARDRPNLVIEMEEQHARRPIESMIGEVTALGYDGFALIDGVLTRWERIDLQARHRAPSHRSQYVFNFVFLPKP